MAGSFSDVAQEDLTCPLCYELFVDPHIPKILDCSHVCCQVCLKRLVKGGKTTIYCPECRQTIHVANSKISSLKTNLRVRSLAEKHIQHGAKVGKMKRRPTITCQNHDGEKMYFHCVTCNTPICQFCLLHCHKDHDVREQKAVVQDKKDNMELVMKEALNDAKSYEARIQGLTDLEHKVEQALKLEEAEIDACAERIRRKCQELKIQLRHGEEERLETIRLEKERLHIQAKNIRIHHTHVENNIDNMTDYDYIMAHDDFMEKMKALTVKEKSVDIYMKPSVSKFVATPGELKLGWFSKTKQINLYQEFGDFESASGIVFTPHGFLTVSDFGNNFVAVFSEQEGGEYKKIMSLTLSSANQCMPVDVATTPDGKFLVVRGSGIEVYSTKGKYKRKIGTTCVEVCETVNNTVDVCSVTTTNDGHILAADYGKSAITVHDPTGRIIKTINTSVKPQCLAAIHDSHVVMSDFHSGKVCIINLETAEETLNVDIPEAQGVCYDEQTDCILVVRNERGSDVGRVFIGTGVIEQYCRTTGRLIACLAQDLYHPRALAFTVDGRLAVADSKSIKVYRNV